MSKYESLWKYIQNDGKEIVKLTFNDIQNITGFEIDHSFLTYKKEVKEYGYTAGKISLKEKTVIFNKMSGNNGS
jgi:hypothetical protein